MAKRVMDASLPLIVYNRTAAKLEPLQVAGAAIAPSPAVLIQASSCIVLMVTNAQAIRDLLLTETSRQELSGKTVIQMSTIAPRESLALRDGIVAAGGDYLEAPVLGSIPEATAGKLSVMVGGTTVQFEKWLPVLQCFGESPRLMGPVGTASAAKLALNQLIGSLTVAFATSLGFVQQQGVEVEAFMEILRRSALYAPTFDKKLQRMVDRDYANPNFPTKHLAKDMGLFATAAAAVGVNPAIAVAVQTILAQTMEKGLADADYSALFDAIHNAASQ